MSFGREVVENRLNDSYASSAPGCRPRVRAAWVYKLEDSSISKDLSVPLQRLRFMTHSTHRITATQNAKPVALALWFGRLKCTVQCKTRGAAERTEVWHRAAMSASLTKTNYVYYQAWKQPLRLPQRYLSGLHLTSPNVKLQNDHDFVQKLRNVSCI